MKHPVIAVLLMLGFCTVAQAQLVGRYTFDHPVEGDPTREQDLGSDKTPINVLNGAQRVDGGAFPGSGKALQSGPIEGNTNNDHKAGIYFENGSKGPNASTMRGTAKVMGITVMGWFKPAANATRTTSMTGILRGDENIAPDPHIARALVEIENIGGGIRVVAMARQRDTDQRRKFRSNRTIAQDLPLNQWSHIAATFNFDTGAVVLYRNGEIVPTTMTEPGSWSMVEGVVDVSSNTPAGGIKVGGQMEGDTTPFTGLIDEVRVYNVDLPATGANSIQSIYREQAGTPATQPSAGRQPIYAQQSGPTVNIQVRDGYRYITSDGMPNHPTGQFPNRGNPNSIQPQNYSFRVPVDPKPAAAPIPLAPQPFGVAVNGLVFDPGTAEFWNDDPSTGWRMEAIGGPYNLGLDQNLAHVQPNGAYHYHGVPTGLMQKLGGATNKPLLLGWAADGFPIYGPLGYTNATDPKSPLKKLAPSYRLKPGQRPSPPQGPGGAHDGAYTLDWEYVAKLGDLDESNGRTGVTPEFPQGTYYYVITDAFPFIPRLFHATPDSSFERQGPGRRGPPRGGRRGPPPRGGPPPF